MINFKFTKDFGSYYFWCDEELVYMSDTIAIAFTIDGKSLTFHKHGNPEFVHGWAKEFKEKFNKAGYDYADDIRVIESNNWDVEDLNKIINITGYMKIIISKYNIQL